MDNVFFFQFQWCIISEVILFNIVQVAAQFNFNLMSMSYTVLFMQTGNHTTEQQLTERFKEMGIEPPKSFSPEFVKVAEEILPPKPAASPRSNSGARIKEVKTEDSKNKSQSSNGGKKEPKSEGTPICEICCQILHERQNNLPNLGITTK